MDGEQLGRKVGGEDLNRAQSVPASLQRNELGEVVPAPTPTPMTDLESPFIKNITPGKNPEEMFRKIVAEEVNSSNIRPTFPENFMEQSLIETSALILNPTGKKGVINVFIDIDCQSCVAAVEDITRTENIKEYGVKLRLIPVLLDPPAGAAADQVRAHVVRSAYFVHTKGIILPRGAALPAEGALKNTMRAVRLNTEFLKKTIAPAVFGVPLVAWESTAGTDGMQGWPIGNLEQLLSTTAQKKTWSILSPR